MKRGQRKEEGGSGSIIASRSASSIPLNLGVGCAPSCWRFSDSEPPGCSQGAQRAVFSAVRVADFLAEGAGWGASPGRGGELGCHGAAGAKKNCEIGVGFSFAAFRSSDFAGPRRPRLYGFHTGTGSLANRKGRRRKRWT